MSVRELRTLLARIEDVPITLGDIHRFEQILHNCSSNYTGPVPHVDPQDYETHYDPDLVDHTHSHTHTHTHTHTEKLIHSLSIPQPLVTEQFFLNCSALLLKVNNSFGERTKYKSVQYLLIPLTHSLTGDDITCYRFQEVGEDDVAFKMLNENGSKVPLSLHLHYYSHSLTDYRAVRLGT